MKNQLGKIILMVLFFLTVACTDAEIRTSMSATKVQDEPEKVIWVEINPPPPGIEGPCWALSTEWAATWKGVWCKH